MSVNERLHAAAAAVDQLRHRAAVRAGQRGRRLDGEGLRRRATSPLTWGVVAGLVVGKFVGITGATRSAAAAARAAARRG